MKLTNTIKALFITAGTRIAPATRYRVCQYLPFLDRAGMRHSEYSVFSEKTTRRMLISSTFGPFRKSSHYIRVVAEKFLRSWKAIWMAGRFDTVLLQRSTFAFGFEWLLRLRNRNIIFDIDDSIYMPEKPEAGPIGWLKRYVKKKEVVSTLGISRCVIAENNHIKNFVQKYCGKVYIITGPIDTVKNYARPYGAPSCGDVVIGWIGSASTMQYLKMMDSVLEELSKRYKIKVRLVGAAAYSLKSVKADVVRWDEATEVRELHKFDIGIMAMPDNEWTRGKVGCKMLQYMANAIPAVVSYTPTNAEIIEDGVNGFLAGPEKEWIEKLSLLIKDPLARQRIGLAGRRTVEERFSLEKNAPRYIEILSAANTMIEFKKALVTGANGMLGEALCSFLASRKIEVLPADLSSGEGIYKLDVRDRPKAIDIIGRHKPDIVFHLAAETDVDKCELEPQHAYEVNARGTENMAFACREFDIPMLYVSTAAVFNGQKSSGYTESDAPDPINVYGKSKLEGEKAVVSLLKKYYIVRTSWMIGGHGKDKKFVYKIAQFLKTKKEIPVVTDKSGSPTFTRHLAAGLFAIAGTGEYGLYHCVNKGICTRFDIAKKIAQYMHKEDVIIKPVTSEAFSLPAPRPDSEGLINARLLSMGMDIMKHWEEALKEYIQEMP